MISLSRRKDWQEHSLALLLLLCVSVSILTTGSVLALLGKELVAFFSEVSPIDFLFGTRWEPLLKPQSFGVLPLVCGTMMIVIGSMLIAAPAGIAVAIYLSEMASDRLQAFLKPFLEILAGIPTVVYGYFALTFVTPLMKSVHPETEIFNAASASIVVGIMILPMVSSLTDDALRSLPRSLKEAAYALGATRYEAIVRVLIPASASRIGAALILAISRAIGETMAVTLAAGATPNMDFNYLEGIQTLTAYIVQVSLGDIPAGGVEYLTCFAVAALLFVLTFGMNFIGNILLKRISKGALK